MTKLFRVVDEASWLACTVPRHMLRFLKDRTSDRKLRLWACASTAQRHAHHAGTQVVVALVEAWADGIRSADLKSYPPDGLCSESAWVAAYDGTIRTLEKMPTSEKKVDATKFQLAAVHEVFGNPFRPVATEPTWLTSDVVALARGIYDDRAFDRMPILADAIQDAGCTNEDVLSHCRDTSRAHVRGCWVVDLILGKP